MLLYRTPRNDFAAAAERSVQSALLSASSHRGAAWAKTTAGYRAKPLSRRLAMRPRPSASR